MKVIFTVGLPGSGKSTWAKDYCERNKNWVRINRDDLRNMRGSYWVPKQEALITEFEHSLILKSLKAGYNVIIDATNLNVDRRNNFIKELVNSTDFSLNPNNITIKSFTDIPIETCIKNDLKRTNSVGEKVIRAKYDKYLKPKVKKYTPNTELPKAIIFDIDGTLAKMTGRSPYDYSRVAEDAVCSVVNELVYLYSSIGYEIIFVSGRDSICKEATQKWLDRHTHIVGSRGFKLYMRTENDTRKDEIIKNELFFNHIANKYHVIAVFDDRNRVVDMWRGIGLKCFQVAPGDF